MSLATAELPADMVSLRAFALACQSELKGFCQRSRQSDLVLRGRAAV